jgi:hypothetical protein
MHFIFYVKLVDMFPPTDSAKSGDDLFSTTDNVKDIKPAGSLHVECVSLLQRETI